MATANKKVIIIIIIIMFSLIALPNQNKVDPKRAKKASSIQNEKWKILHSPR